MSLPGTWQPARTQMPGAPTAALCRRQQHTPRGLLAACDAGWRAQDDPMVVMRRIVNDQWNIKYPPYLSAAAKVPLGC